MAAFLQTGDFLLRGLSAHHHGGGDKNEGFALHRRPASRLVTSFALIGAQSKLQNEEDAREGQTPFGDTPLKTDDFSTAPKLSSLLDDNDWEIDISEAEWGANDGIIAHHSTETAADDDWFITPANDSDADIAARYSGTEYAIDVSDNDDNSDNDPIDDDLVDQLLAELDFDFDFDFDDEEESGSSGGGGGISRAQEEEIDAPEKAAETIDDIDNSANVADFLTTEQSEKPNFDDLIRRVCSEVEHHKGGANHERSSLVRKHLNSYMQDFKLDMMQEYETGSLLWFGAWLLDSSRNRCWLEMQRQTGKSGTGSPKANKKRAA